MSAKGNGFLDIARRVYGEGAYSGDEYGGGAGRNGSGLPTGDAGDFMFATGIECSYPKVQNGTVRRDLLEECGHYRNWKEDLHLVKDLGLKVLRYGLPYYRMHLAPGRFDWEFADLAMDEIRRLGLTPILDLLHFGVPDWVGDFQNPEFPIHFAEFGAAVAHRYPWVRYYTPVNEIYVTARISALEGGWNEALRSDRGFVTAMKHLCAASILANHAIARHRPDCIIVQSESAEYTHQTKAARDPQIDLKNDLRLMSLDLLYAHPLEADVLLYAMDNGLTRDEYEWFMVAEPPGYQIMGNDYYGRNEHILLPDGSTCEGEDVLGWYQITRDYYDRYRRPVMHTETNTFDASQASNWLWKQWINVIRMRRDNVPVLGFTWYSLVDQVDWDIQLREKRGKVNEVGLYDLDRNPRPVATAYRSLLEEFGQITIVPHGELFEVTDREALLKVDV